MLKELQEKEVFGEIIYGKLLILYCIAHTFESSSVHRLTKSGYRRHKDLQKNCNKISKTI